MGGSAPEAARAGADTTHAALRVSPVSPVPERLAVGEGTAIFLDGLCSHAGGPVRDLRVLVDEEEHAVLAEGMPPPGAFRGSDYWWAIVALGPVDRPRRVRLRLRARTADGAEATGELGVVELRRRTEVAELAAPPRPRGATAASPLVAVCMATYEPPIDLFRRQVESIRAQTRENWVCLISDDHSSPERLEEMRAVLGDDERFALVAHGDRLGFYGNFERALALAPPEAAYVAMCDQDDRWYPDKLAVLEEQLRSGATLAYSDMRIVDRSGNVRFDTYWRYRRNNHTNFGSLLMANTVTGAASLFTREVLDRALPFPPRYGANYHDHWVALVAMTLGEIAYVDRPLYDYVQHGGAVIGHARANGLERDVPRGAAPADRLGQALARLERIAPVRVPRGMRYFYFTHYCGSLITAKVAELRCGALAAPGKRRVLRLFGRPHQAFAWLALRSPRRWTGRTETLRREQALLGGLTWRHYAEWRRRLAAREGRRSRGARGVVRDARRPARAGAAPRVAPADFAVLRPTVGASSNGGGPPAPTEPWLTPILVDYFTRDGSTLTMRLLATSPQVAVEDQYPYERKYFGYLWRWSRLLDRGQWPSDEWGPSALASITQERHGGTFGPPPWHPRTLMESAPGEPTMSRRAFDLAWGEFSRRAAAAAPAAREGVDARFYAEKHLDSWLLDRAELPPFELLVLLRDPRDTYVSITAFNRLRGTAGFGRDRAGSDREHLDGLIARQRERLRWIAGLLDGDGDQVVRYEDLVSDLPGVAARLERRFGIELDPLAAAEDSQLRRAHVSAESPESSVGRWRRELDPDVARLFRRELGDELSAVGFEV